jgi:hypothetical protein
LGAVVVGPSDHPCPQTATASTWTPTTTTIPTSSCRTSAATAGGDYREHDRDLDGGMDQKFSDEDHDGRHDIGVLDTDGDGHHDGIRKLH